MVTYPVLAAGPAGFWQGIGRVDQCIKPEHPTVSADNPTPAQAGCDSRRPRTGPAANRTGQAGRSGSGTAHRGRGHMSIAESKGKAYGGEARC
jgi:hypothetical protein